MLTGHVTVVMATRNRRPGLCRTLEHLAALPEQPPIVVVDNGSDDGTVAAVRRSFPQVEVVELRRNYGAYARNHGVRRARTPYVALSDDDSWWEPGALTRAVSVLEAHPRLGVVAGATMVGEEAEPDPINAVLAASPLPQGSLPGPRVLGFLGCAAVARRDAYLAAGGYSRMLCIGGEEELLAYDLAALGWPISYRPDVVVHHWPSAARDARRRRIQELRNHALIGWLRRPLLRAVADTARLAAAARRHRDPVAARALAETLATLPRALLQRCPLPAPVEADIRLLESTRAN
ncbi:MAG TPA: glycosyltransferase [Streptosporangiaceae bacterium]|jgi:GT2 family glycosyltransferase|nr:glycosyltransferase [Streptosporangiaceae bacterium]